MYSVSKFASYTAFIFFMAGSCHAQSLQRGVTSGFCASNGGRFTYTGRLGTDIGECYIPPRVNRASPHSGLSTPGSVGSQAGALLGLAGDLANSLNEVSPGDRLSCSDYVKKLSAQYISTSDGPEDSTYKSRCEFNRDKLIPRAKYVIDMLERYPDCQDVLEQYQSLRDTYKNVIANTNDICMKAKIENAGKGNIKTTRSALKAASSGSDAAPGAPDQRCLVIGPSRNTGIGCDLGKRWQMTKVRSAGGPSCQKNIRFTYMEPNGEAAAGSEITPESLQTCGGPPRNITILPD